MKNKYDIAAIAATNDLEGDEYTKLSAAQQRELFGCVPFGRKSVNFDPDGQGTVRVASSACFGTDGNVTRMSYEQFAQCVNEQKKID